MSNETPAWTYESFATAASKVFCEITKAMRLRSERSHVFSYAGLPVPTDDGSDGTPTIAIPTEAPDTYVGAGLTLADLNESARAKRDAKRLRELRQTVYLVLRDLSRDSYSGIEASQITRHLGTLGFPQPVTTTRVAVTFWDKSGNERYQAFTVPQKVTQEEVTKAMQPHIGQEPGAAAVLAAFPTATGTNLPISCSTRHSEAWADASDIK